MMSGGSFYEKPHGSDQTGLWTNDVNAPSIFGPRLIGFSPKVAYSFPMSDLNIKTDVHLSVAFVELSMEFYLEASPQFETSSNSFVFELPTRHYATVTHCVCELEKNKVFECQIVEDTPGADSTYKSREGRGMAIAMQIYREHSGKDIGQYDPEMFAFPFHGANIGEKVKLIVSYSQNMSYENSAYHLRVPLTFEEALFSRTLERSVKLDVRISTGMTTSSGVKYGSLTHADSIEEVKVDDDAESEDGVFKIIQLKRNAERTWKNGDLSLFFVANSENDEIIPRAIFQQAPNRDNDPEKDQGILSIFIAPPREHITAPVSKDVVFILDRSGSMGFSDVMEAAKEALVQGLQDLNPGDRFAICAFDDKQIWFAGALPHPPKDVFDRFFAKLVNPNSVEQASSSSGDYGDHVILGAEGKATGITISNGDVQGTARVSTPEDKRLNQNGVPQPQQMQKHPNALLRASPGNIEKAVHWVKRLHAGGLTDILSPMEQAVYALHSHKQVEEIQKGISTSRISMMFVITDGAVENERDICRFAQRIADTTRIFSFGIGRDCNAYFLRKLASLGRGYTDIALIQREVKGQMSALFKCAKLPILTELAVSLQQEKGLSEIMWCPSRFPDLFYNAPVMVSMKYKGKLTNGTSLTVQGQLSSGNNEKCVYYLEQVDANETTRLPLRKVFAQQLVQEMIANSWLADLETDAGKKIRREAVDFAISEQITTPFTQKAVIETTKEEHEKRTAQEQMDDSSDWNRKNSRYQTFARKHGVVIIGAVGAAVAFGSVAATIAGGGAFGDAAVFGAEGGGDCCNGDCCGDGCMDDCLGCCEGCEC